MANSALEGLNYPEVFTALGKLIEENELHDVVVMEFEQGIIVTGAVTQEVGTGYDHKVETFVLSGADLRSMLSNKGMKSLKRGLFRR